MKNILRAILVSLVFLLPQKMFSQCTITNATSCVCEDASSNCDLLPDITISWYGLQTYAGGPTEYAQTGAGADDGHLRVTGSTPNIGYGPFTVEAVQMECIGSFVEPILLQLLLHKLLFVQMVKLRRKFYGNVFIIKIMVQCLFGTGSREQ